MNHKYNFAIVFRKRLPNFEILHIKKVYRIFIFSSNFDAVLFSVNWFGWKPCHSLCRELQVVCRSLCRELQVGCHSLCRDLQVVCWPISSIIL